LTIAKSLYYNNEFIGVAGSDIRVIDLQNLLQNVIIGYNSYSFIINNKGETIAHPLLPTDNDYVNNIFTSPVTPDISLLEPNEFTQFIKQDMILGKTGYKKITAHVRQIAGDAKRNGYLL